MTTRKHCSWGRERDVSLARQAVCASVFFDWKDHGNQANSVSDDTTELERQLQRGSWGGSNTGQGWRLGAPELWSW